MTMMEVSPDHLRTCPTCGLLQRMPPEASALDAPRHARVCCARCQATLRLPRDFARHDALTASLAIAALILYPVAISMPIISVHQMGNASSSSIVDGVIALMAGGEVFVGLIVLFCSIILPLGKLFALATMSLLGPRLAHSHRALTHRVIEFTGRWGMLDVLAVAVLVAALKLGNMMEVTPGPAAFTFCLCVLLSLLASATFDPHGMWEQDAAPIAPATEAAA